MAKYEKWLGAGLGWVVTGNPLGGLLGFIAGGLLEKGTASGKPEILDGISEFEANLMVLASHLIKIDGKVQIQEISFALDFLNTHFNKKFSEKRSRVLHHCLQKEYDLNIICEQIRMYTQRGTRVQVVHFLFDLAMSDGDLNERENYFIFKVAGFLTVNDVEFKKIRAEHIDRQSSAYDILGVSAASSLAEIRNAYRRLVLKYHPDRSAHLSEAEKKSLALKFQQIKEAYEKLKKEMESR